MIACAPALLPAQPAGEPGPGNGAPLKQRGAIENLASIQQSIEAKRSAIRDLREQLKRIEDSSERQEFEQKIERSRNDILGLQQSFEHIALGGINLSILDDQVEEQIDWRSELIPSNARLRPENIADWLMQNKIPAHTRTFTDSASID